MAAELPSATAQDPVALPDDWPTRRDIFRIAAPMILTNVSIPLLGIVDTAVLGHLPDPRYLGAVAIGSMIFGIVFWGFGFLRMGTTGLVAQDFGRGRERAVSNHLVQALLLALACAALLLLAQTAIRDLALGLTETEPEIEAGAALYFNIRIWAAPMTLGTHALVGWFLGRQNARGPLVMLLAANLSNVVLDLWFVVGLGWGVAGVAWASVIGETLGVVVGGGLALRTGAIHRPRRDEVFDVPALKAMLHLNRNIMLRTFCLIFVFAFIPWWGASLGKSVLAANAVLMNFQNFMSYALDGFAHAAEAFIGRAKGAADPAAFRRALASTGRWSVGVAVLFCAFYGLAGRELVHAMTDLPSVRATAVTYLPWMVLLPAVSVWSYWLDGVFIGATWSRAMLRAMLVASFLVFVPVWWLTRDWGNHGLWLAFTAFMVARAVTMGWALSRRDREVLSA